MLMTELHLVRQHARLSATMAMVVTMVLARMLAHCAQRQVARCPTLLLHLQPWVPEAQRLPPPSTEHAGHDAHMHTHVATAPVHHALAAAAAVVAAEARLLWLVKVLKLAPLPGS
eukprot:scaffold149051_cov17-Tisochrysis_lutea.AAC.1